MAALQLLTSVQTVVLLKVVSGIAQCNGAAAVGFCAKCTGLQGKDGNMHLGSQALTLRQILASITFCGMCMHGITGKGKDGKTHLSCKALKLQRCSCMVAIVS